MIKTAYKILVIIILFPLVSSASEGSISESENAGRASVRELHVDRNTDNVHIGSHINFFCTSDANVTIDNLPLNRLEPLLRSDINFGQTSEVCWLQLKIRNVTSTIESYKLELPMSSIDYIDIYYRSDDSDKHIKLGDRRPFTERELAISVNTANIELPPKELVTVWVSMSSSDILFSPIIISHTNRHLEKKFVDLIFTGIFYGLSLGFVVLNLLLYLSFRDREFVYYIVFVMMMMSLFLYLDGYAFQLWPYSITWQNVCLHISTCLAMWASVLFIQHYLILKEVPSLSLVGKVLSGCLLLVGTIQIVTFSPYPLVVNALGISVSLFLVVCCIVRLVQGMEEAKYYAMSWLVFIGSTSVIIFNTLGYMESLGMAFTALKLGFVLQQAILSIGLYKNVKNLQLTRQVSILEKELSQAENKAKSQFFASMSHELRTPLTAILGYSEAANTTEINSQQRESYLETIHRGGQHLLQLVNDILDLSKIEAQKLNLESLDVGTFELLHEVEDYFTILAEKKGIEFDINYQYPLPKTFTSDPTRLKQTLINICGNAIKFTEKGGVTIRVYCDYAREQISFSVHDTGIGLKPDQVNRLFSAFSQADASTTRNFGGTGLGLHLSKQIAEKLGGDITVESNYGKGSVFTVSVSTGNLNSVPLAYEIPSTMPKLQEAIVKVPTLRGHILYAEDNPQNQELVSHIVKKTGCTIDVVSNGRKALEYMGRKHYDLVFTDIRMPEIDGVELCETVKKFKPNLPVIAITATATDNEIREFSNVGFGKVLRKPIDRGMLYQTMQDYLTEASCVKSKMPLRVLLAEDNLDNQALIKLHLKRLHCEVVCVNDGVEVLAQALASECDLILMDMQMPNMDGMTAVRYLRGKGYEQPIYSLTANETPEAIQESLEAGCQGHLSKPLDTEKLKSVIENIRPRNAGAASNIIAFKVEDGLRVSAG